MSKLLEPQIESANTFDPAFKVDDFKYISDTKLCDYEMGVIAGVDKTADAKPIGTHLQTNTFHLKRNR